MQTQLPGKLPGELPDVLNFMRQVELKRVIEGEYPISKLTRLSDVLSGDDGTVSARIEFGESVGFACVKGSVSATLLTECQRCLKPLETRVSGTFKFALLHDEEDFDLLPDDLEPYLLEGDEQSIIQLVEDELLLSLPMVAVHDEPCSEFMIDQDERLEAEKAASHPFAALKTLKEDLDDKVN